MHFNVFGRAAKGLALAALVACLSSAAMAQNYPTRPITIKVAFPAGGPSDASIRAANIVLQRNLGQSLISENVPGATGSISAMAVLNAQPDGYTLLGTTGSDFVVAPFTIASAKYKPDSFKLLGVTGVSDFILVSNTNYS
ncbi:MAG: tripartite tricarboxylate transporter substrate binding protein, partial [Candidatus Afipia apatlaquensis]|nr:tripartite tricarboxylate transporter substrate binding protein [Candidatus Afipia apatlaquensis]